MSLEPNMDELLSLFNKYKININEIGSGDEVKLERFGVTITFSQRRLCEERAKKVCAEILKTFIQHPEYKAKTMKYVSALAKKPIPIDSTVSTPVLTVEEKKRLIRNKLTKEGLLS